MVRESLNARVNAQSFEELAKINRYAGESADDYVNRMERASESAYNEQREW